jgi:hypothetical protein
MHGTIFMLIDNLVGGALAGSFMCWVVGRTNGRMMWAVVRAALTGPGSVSVLREEDDGSISVIHEASRGRPGPKY